VSMVTAEPLIISLSALFRTLQLPPVSLLFPYTTLFRSLVGLVREAELRGVRAEEAAWMRLEGHGERGHAARSAHRQRRTDHGARSEEHTSELPSRFDLVCRLLLEKKKRKVAKISIRRLT